MGSRARSTQLTDPGWGDELLLRVDAWIAKRGAAYRLAWIDTPPPYVDPDTFRPHYAWQERIVDDTGARSWGTLSTHQSIAEFAAWAEIS